MRDRGFVQPHDVSVTKSKKCQFDFHDFARADIASYIAYYNTERRHSSLDYLSPTQFETLQALSN